MSTTLLDGHGSFRRQIMILTSCVTALAMLVLTVVLQLILADLSRSSVDRVLEDRADAVVGAVDSASAGSRLEVPPAELDRGVAVYDSTGRSLAGVEAEGLHAAYAALKDSSTRKYLTFQDTRLVAAPFTTSQGAAGVVVVPERLAAYEAAQHYALIVSLVTGALATAAAAGVAAWVTSRALRPVAALASTAVDWSEHDLSRRFALGAPTNEITALAAILDTLLDKVSTAIRSEQRLTSELAHELRTPLTAVQGAADLALLYDDLGPDLRETLTEIAAASRRMATTITTLLDLARNETSRLESSSCSVAEVVADVLRGVVNDRVDVDVRVGAQRVAVPPAILARALAPVVENAVRLARSHVVISCPEGTAGDVRVLIEDDGPGVDGPTEAIFLPGTSRSGGSGAGLGLSIARRMARSVGGELDVLSPRDPTRFELRLPRG